MEKIKDFYTKWKALILAISVVIVLFFPFIYFVPQLFVKTYYCIYPEKSTATAELPATQASPTTTYVTPAVTGPIGDTFGGTLGPVIAICAALLTFMAFYIQYQANEQQKDYIRKQRFEDTFFKLIESHNNIVNSIDIRDSKDLSKVKATSRESFKFMFNDLEKATISNKTVDNIKAEYNNIQDRHKSDLHHYFRTVYHILKFIRSSDIEEIEKYKYASMLRAMFSAHELALLFYNGIHQFGEKLKPLLEEFSFLKNIDGTLVLNSDLWGEYHPLVRAESERRAALYDDWKKQHTKP